MTLNQKMSKNVLECSEEPKNAKILCTKSRGGGGRLHRGPAATPRGDSQHQGGSLQVQEVGQLILTLYFVSRLNANGRPTKNIGQDLIEEYRYPLEEYMDNLFHHVEEDLRQGSRESYRF